MWIVPVSKPFGPSSRCLGRRFVVFDVDATRQAGRARALPCASELPPLDADEGAV